jgi:hypothetical protein
LWYIGGNLLYKIADMPFENPHNAEKDEDADKPLYTRREITKAAGTGLAIGSIGTGLIAQEIFGRDTQEENTVERKEGGYESSELFQREMAGYKMLYSELKRDEILFVNEEGMPLGKPVKVESVNGISPGTIDKNGFLTEDMNQDWLDYQRERVCAELEVPCDIPNGLPRQINVIPQLRDTVYYTPDDDLDPENYLEVIEYFAGKKVIGAEHKTRLEFVRDHVGDSLKVPPAVKEELIALIPGLAAQESHFNNGLKSSVGAEGIFQFMPDTWKDFGYSEEDLLYLKNQVEAVGKYFSRAYTFLKNNAGRALTIAEREYFNGSAEDFGRDFLAPVLLNSYNAGPGRLATTLKWFIEQYPPRESLEKSIGTHAGGFGKDAYQALTNKAKGVIPGYGRDSSQYVVRLSALAELLKDK